MSRIGKKPIVVPNNVKVSVTGDIVYIEGPKGKLEQKIPFGITLEVANNNIVVNRLNNSKPNKSLHGTIRNLIMNMIKGVTEGYTRELEIIGVGYRAQVKGKDISIQLGFTHHVNIPIPSDIKVIIPKPTQIVIQGVDKAKVGQLAADVRIVCPPEPYKGKGIRYLNEYVKKKQGKAVTK